MSKTVLRILEKSRDRGGAQNGDRCTGVETGSQDAGMVSPDRGVPEQRDGRKGVVQIAGNRNHDLFTNGRRQHMKITRDHPRACGE